MAVVVKTECSFAAHVLPVKTVAGASYMPSYAHAGDAGADLRACGTVLVQPGYATFGGGHVVLCDLVYCPACGARVIGRGVE